ncbi:LOW QUALITY PROTEIN: RAS guanyl-releasing protein 2-like [Zonotrichia albicollis]|uniref:LOW QUALITY PROTEIN: RAS guanyl-releasing protein 2-like n=1 Tax=Zonotrichia albicollis TaxID=44394 RepID=UPI003D80B4DA
MSSSLDLDRAPTLDELLRGCVDAFDAQGKVRDPQLVRLFLATHPWYLPQAEVASKLLTLYPWGPPETPPKPPGTPKTPRDPQIPRDPPKLPGIPLKTLPQVKGGAGKMPRFSPWGPPQKTPWDPPGHPKESGGSAEGPSLRLKIGHLVRYWVRAFLRELSGDPQVLGRLRELGAALGGDPQKPLLGLESLKGTPRPKVTMTRPEVTMGGVPMGGGPPGGGGVVAPPRARFSMLLEPLEPPELALLLTHLEHRGYGAIRLRDIRVFARSAGTSSSPSLRRLVALSNGLSRWVQLRVLRPLAAPQRAAALGQCLRLGQSLLELRNFNSLLAVVGGLGHGSIARLRRTLALLEPPLVQLWAQLAEAVGSGGNYRRYRALLGGAGGSGGFRVPALGVHLRDLVALEAALPDWGGPGRPHPNKLRARFALQGALLAGREQGPPGTPHPDLLRLLEVSLALGPSEEQLHQMSLQREPRESAPVRPGREQREGITGEYKKKSGAECAKGAKGGCECARGFGGSAPPRRPLPSPPRPGPPRSCPPPSPPSAGSCPSPPRPDPEGLQPRLEQLVESIFRNFDVDGDGRISVEEFGIVRENFPHLPPLGELDTDMDGGLSRGEVLDYFLLQPRTPPGTPPQFPGAAGAPCGPCESCGKLIWGLHKDGMECSGCGLRCHIACRDRLRPECRRRAQSVTAAPPDPPGPLPKSRPPLLQPLPALAPPRLAATLRWDPQKSGPPPSPKMRDPPKRRGPSGGTPKIGTSPHKMRGPSGGRDPQNDPPQK